MSSAPPAFEPLLVLPVPLIVLDPRGRIQTVNGATLSMLGYEEPELNGRELESICAIAELGLSSADELCGLSLFEKRTTMRPKSGESIPVQFSSAPAFDEHGELRAIYCTAHDMRARVALEEELREAAQHYQKIVERSAMGIYQTSADGKFLSANPALARLHGFDSPQELIEATKDIAGDSYVELGRRAEFIAAVEKGPVHSFVSEIKIADGKTRWVRETAHAVRDADGTLLHYEGTVADITESKLAFEDSERSKEALEEVNRRLKENQGQLLQSEKMAMVGQLASGVAHEINNPVGFVLSNLNTLGEYEADLATLLALYEELEGLASSEDRIAAESKLREIQEHKEEMDLEFLLEDLKSLVTESRDGAERVRKIVRDLRDFAHLDRKERMPADINAGIESTLNIVWNELKYKAEVQRDYGDLPEVMCYPMELNQVFMNMLVNAGHAIDEKGTITIRTYVEDDSVCVAISDTGVGMSPEVQEKVFTPFFTTKDVGEGTGLGLSMSYNIVVEKHKGEIHLESEEGKGTTFTIKIPVSEADDG